MNVLMLQLRLEFYFLQTDAAGKEHVHELAVGCSWGDKKSAGVSFSIRPRCRWDAGQEGLPSPAASWPGMPSRPCAPSYHVMPSWSQAWVWAGRDGAQCSCTWPCGPGAVPTASPGVMDSEHSPRRSCQGNWVRQLRLASTRNNKAIFSFIQLQVIKTHRRKIKTAEILT